jgi:hypothetical protein
MSEFLRVCQDIIYLLMHSTVSCKTLHGISVDTLLQNTVLEIVNGSCLFSFSDPTEETKLFYLWFSKTSHY